MKLVNGQWTADLLGASAINEIGDKLMEIRDKSGADSVYLARLGEIHQRGRLSEPQVRGLLGHQQLDHQARICHSTTVAGVANTWGYGAMTNSYNDIRNSKTIDHHGRQSRGSASGVAAAPARRQGAPAREHDRDRSAPDPHRGARDRICAHPLRHRHRR